VCHGQYAQVVVLILSVELAVNGITWSTVSNAIWATALCYESIDDTVKFQAIVEAVIGELYEVGDGLRCVIFKKLNGHVSAVGGYFCLHLSVFECLLRSTVF
jgi:hypothetical protein